jgi:hypothetical protein
MCSSERDGPFPCETMELTAAATRVVREERRRLLRPGAGVGVAEQEHRASVVEGQQDVNALGLAVEPQSDAPRGGDVDNFTQALQIEPPGLGQRVVERRPAAGGVANRVEHLAVGRPADHMQRRGILGHRASLMA